MKTKVIFILSAPLYVGDYKRFGADILIENGFEVEFYNIAPYVYPDLFYNATKKNIYKGGNHQYFYDKKTILNEINCRDGNPFYVLLLHYNKYTYHIFKGISKNKLPYAVAIISAVPTCSFKIKTNLLERIKALKIDHLSNKILNRLYSTRYSKIFGISPPAVILMGAEKCLKHHLYLLADNNTDILSLHTFDYDNHLKSDVPYHGDSKIAVFIDAPSPRFKFDAYIPSITSPLTEEKYYPSLCNLFDVIEDKYSVKVEIAAHPKSEHNSNPEYFGGRLVRNNRTLSMIKNSEFVINRNSTSINYAIIYNKAILFHTSDEIEFSSSTMKDQIKSMASSVNKTAVNIDHLDDIEWDSELKIDKRAYNQYRNDYIKKDGTEDIPIWQSFANWLKGRS